MANPLQQAGIFRGHIAEYGLREPDSGAVGVNLRVAVDDVWDSDNQEWADWKEYDFEVYGCVWIIKKDGTVNDRSAQSLIKATGWDGNMEAISGGTWQPTPCQVVVNEEKPNEYHKDASRFSIAFVNEYDRVPGAVGNVSPDRAKELQSRFGSQFRALVGDAVRNSVPPPASRPKAPAPRKESPTAARKAIEPYPDVNAQDPNEAFQEAAAEQGEGSRYILSKTE